MGLVRASEHHRHVCIEKGGGFGEGGVNAECRLKVERVCRGETDSVRSTEGTKKKKGKRDGTVLTMRFSPDVLALSALLCSGNRVPGGSGYNSRHCLTVLTVLTVSLMASDGCSLYAPVLVHPVNSWEFRCLMDIVPGNGGHDFC